MKVAVAAKSVSAHAPTLWLSAWLEKNDMNPAEFGRRLGLKYPRNVYRYVHGRMPAQDMVQRIVKETADEVGYADFYDGE